MKYERSDNFMENTDNVILDLLHFLNKERYSNNKSDSSSLTSTLSRQNTTKISTLFDEEQLLGLGRLNAIVLEDNKLLMMGSTYDAQNVYYEFALFANADRHYLRKKNDKIELIYIDLFTRNWDGKYMTLYETDNPDRIIVPRLDDISNIENLLIPINRLVDVISYKQLFERARTLDNVEKGQR